MAECCTMKRDPVLALSARQFAVLELTLLIKLCMVYQPSTILLIEVLAQPSTVSDHSTCCSQSALLILLPTRL